MIDNRKTISVLMSVFNEKEDYLKKSLDSILCQSFENFEFLIIDDGGTEKRCREILDEYVQKDTRIQLFRNETNLGLAKSLNLGLKKAEGKYIARIDSDDMADIHRLEKQLEFMENNPDYALCGSWSHIIDENSNITGKKKFFTDYTKIKKNLLLFNFFTHSSLFFRRDLIAELEGYNEKLKKAQDYDLLLKISARHPVVIIPEFLCSNRIWPGSITSKGKKKQEWCALKARWNALWSYGYPKMYFYQLIPSFLYFLFIPYFIEKQLFKFLWKK